MEDREPASRASGRRRERILNGVTGLCLLASGGYFAHERLLPAWERARTVQVGERMPRSLAFEALATGDTVRFLRGTPGLFLVFRSTCPVCREALPAWRRLLRELPPRFRRYAVVTEASGEALEYVRGRLGRALALRPLPTSSFFGRLGIDVVPTTLVVDADGRLRRRVLGVPDAALVDSILARAGGPARRAGSPAGAPAPSSSTSTGGGS